MHNCYKSVAIQNDISFAWFQICCEFILSKNDAILKIMDSGLLFSTKQGLRVGYYAESL